MLAPPVVVGIVTEHGGVDEAAAGADAVVFGACVELLRASPGNCTAVCGLTDAAALPTVVCDEEPEAGTAAVVGTVEVGTLSGSDAGTDWSAIGGAAGTVLSVAGAGCGLA